jgi:tRNA 5-methylaminomethyl-2-thiouridine biosynthesis bifunctional protein
VTPALQALLALIWRETRLSLNLLLVGPSSAEVRALDAQLDTHPPRHIHWVLLDAQATDFSRETLGCGELTVWPGAGPSALRGGIGVFHGVHLDAPEQANGRDWAKALRPHVAQGTWLHRPSGFASDAVGQWSSAGWVCPADAPHTAHFAPRWSAPQHPDEPQRQVTVIGAGLAGAATAHALSQRGWHVDWLDAGAHWASGASALPVGLLSRHRTAQATPMSELADVALPHTVHALSHLLPGQQGWQATWVDQLPSARGGPPPGREPAWLVQPAALVNAWAQAALASGRVRWRPEQTVTQIRCEAGLWHSLNAQDAPIAATPHLVLANAYGARALLGEQAPALRPVAGQMSWGHWPSDTPPCAPYPRRSHGVLTPSFDAPQGRIWAVGSTYRRGVEAPLLLDSDHDANAESLARLCPAASPVFHAQRARGDLRAFVSVRCASRDRMPLVGTLPQAQAPWPARGGLAAVPRQTGLHIISGLGSRGLTLAAWAAHTLADQLEAVPLDTPAHLVQACDPARKGLRSDAR